MIAGIDEAGRGPLAGPVVAASVILNSSAPIEGLNDSKKLSEKKRDALFECIQKHAIAVGVGIVDVDEIDSMNILQATLYAMQQAYNAMPIKAESALVDGNIAPTLPCPTQTIIKGDASEACIGAASIIAKVTRDNIMRVLDKSFPMYHFAKHKGYGTRLHLEALAQYGPSPVHRLSFAPVRKLAESVCAK